MADRYDERFRREYGRERHSDEDRGMMDRAGDEVRSWFGDDDAARRRERDERESERSRGYGRSYESGRAPERWSARADRDPGGRPRSGESTWREDDWRGGRDPRESRASDHYRRESEMNFGAGSAFGGGSGFGAAYGTGTGYATRRDYGTTSGGLDRDQYDRSPQRENYAGRGPKGYRRSDERIREDVSDRLTDDPMIDASDVEVTVSDCEVTLSGFVRQREDKRRAEDVAERISGVREVHNSLRLRRDDETSAPTPQATETTTGTTARTQGKRPDR